jgi:hypothetical protein
VSERNCRQRPSETDVWEQGHSSVDDRQGQVSSI